MIICSCQNINEKKIEAFVKEHESAHLNHKKIYQKFSKETRCGKQCGKCVPDVLKIIKTNLHTPQMPSHLQFTEK